MASCGVFPFLGNTHTHKCVRTHMRTHKRAHTHKSSAHMHRHTHTGTNIHIHTHAHSCTHAQAHANIHTSTNIHTCTHTRLPLNESGGDTRARWFAVVRAARWPDASHKCSEAGCPGSGQGTGAGPLYSRRRQGLLRGHHWQLCPRGGVHALAPT